MRIERLGADRIADMRAMNRLFGDVFGDAAGYAGNPPSDDYLRDLLADPTFFALAAFDEDEMIGALAGYELRKFEKQRSEFYIYDLAVVEPHRRRGVATALIQALKPLARERGGWVIFVQADHGDEPAIALYEKLGRREDVIHFDIAPGDQPKAER